MLINKNNFNIDVCNKWENEPKTVFIVEKIKDRESRKYLIKVSKFLHETKGLMIYVERNVKEELTDLDFLQTFSGCESIDFILSFGGDGTLLHLSSLFPLRCPPVIPFAMGSLGFLTPFSAEKYEEIINKFIDRPSKVTLRTRAVGTIYRDGKVKESHLVLNDIVVSSIIKDAVCILECFLNDNHFSTVYGDGLIVSTSTGSTAYNLSAGGVLVHPLVASLLWTPICPHSLNAHPLILPGTVKLGIKISQDSRTSNFSISFDSYRTTIDKNDFVSIKLSPNPLPTVCKHEPMNDWLFSISNVFGWNRQIEDDGNSE